MKNEKVMIIKKKENNPNGSTPWTKSERKTLKVMVKEGKTLKEIAQELGRSVGAVGYQKSSMGLSMKRVKKVKVKLPSGKEVKMRIPPVVPSDSEMSPRDSAKHMASVARQVARANGKRITMAMFFVEDL